MVRASHPGGSGWDEIECGCGGGAAAPPPAVVTTGGALPPTLPLPPPTGVVAAAGMPPDTQGLELLVIPLPTALERMVAQPGDDGLVFEIIPPGDSVDFVRQFLAAPTPAQAASVFPDINIFPS